MIKYIGSKRTLIPPLQAAFSDLQPGARVLDLFTGTTRVAQSLKALGLYVQANDHNHYAWMNARCYIEADGQIDTDAATQLITELSQTAPEPGWFTQRYCHEARFFHPDNGARIEAIRNRIDSLCLSPTLEAIALVSLMEAADRVDSTTGVQMAYLKQWAARAANPLQLRLPQLIAGPGKATCMDALECATAYSGSAAYLDPPYNQHNYRANYHVWETLMQWDNPEVYGVVCKRMDCKSEKSDFNSKRRIHAAFKAVVQALDVPRLVVSFSNEGFLTQDQIEETLREHGHVSTVAVDHKRYVGAQIGIYNPEGQAVGEVSHLTNQELIFVVDSSSKRAQECAARVASAVGPKKSR